MRLSVGHIIGGDQNFRDRQAHQPQAAGGQEPRARGDYAPLSLRNRGDERSCARHRNNALTVSDFASLDLPHLGRSIEMWCLALDHFNRTHSMSDRHDMFRIQALLLCPGAPVSFHGTCGIHENAIQIEENRRAVENWHPDLFTTGFAAWGRKATLSVRATARFRSEIRTAWLEFLESRALVRGKARLPSFPRPTLRLSECSSPHRLRLLCARGKAGLGRRRQH